jgi:PTS system mannose-specific IIA component
MIGKLVLTHGGLARELLAAAAVIAGNTEGFEALSLEWNDDFEAARAKVAAALARLDQGEGVLILTDMFGGTPSNVALTFQQPGRIEILTGVNLPMVVRLACQGLEQRGLTEVARWLQVKGQRSVCLASEVGQQTGDAKGVRPDPCGKPETKQG